MSHGVVGGYVYDPPLDDYAGAEFVEPSPARWFASRVLPADPLLARRITNALKKERAATVLPSLPTPVPDTTPPASLGQ